MKKLFLIVTMLLSPFQFQATDSSKEIDHQKTEQKAPCDCDYCYGDGIKPDDSEVGAVVCGVVGGQLVIIIGASLAEIAVAPIIVPLGIAGVAIVSGKVGYDYALGRYETLDEAAIKKQAGKKACEEIKKAFAELGNDDMYRKLKTIPTSIDCDKEHLENDADAKAADNADLLAVIIDGEIHMSYSGKKFINYICADAQAAATTIIAINDIVGKSAVDNIKIYRRSNPVDIK